MASKKIRQILLMIGAVFLCVGFKPYPGVKGWKMDPSTTAGRKVFISLSASGKTLNNNLPATDALNAAGTTLTETQLLTSIMNDYNSIQSSNLMLVADSDTDYAAYNTDHRIKIEDGSASGVSSGEAQTTLSGAYISGCTIKLTSKAYEDAKTYVRLLTHEIGHCIGLAHSQETVWAVMSYFYNEDVYRLAIDDKMGIVYLYSKDSSYAEEKPTLGFSCATR